MTISLQPLAFLFGFIVYLRKKAYQYKLFKSVKLPTSVIVVGNITAGGSGKTPIVIALAKALKDKGYKPGIISRGYRGKSKHWPRSVNENSDPKQVGDEPVLIAMKTGCPVVVAPNRVAAAKQCLSENECDVLISDDGLQHYALQRDFEIAVINASQGLGNERLLPAGRLREPRSRLNSVDCVVVNGIASEQYHPQQFSVSVAAGEIYQLTNPKQKLSVDLCKNKKIFAIAGIANPQRFLKTLQELGFRFITPLFYLDHHNFFPEDINLPGADHLMIMTEKDAVKCRRFAGERHWALPIEANLPDNLLISIEKHVFS